MSIPTPKPGLVIRYNFLWSSEHQQGTVEGSKDRPCAIVGAAPRDEHGHIRTIVAPITHSAPDDLETSLEIPAGICRSLGLDDGRHWLRFDELNSFLWPGYDLRPRSDGRYDYGMLPRGLFETLRKGILEAQRRKAGRIINRQD